MLFVEINLILWLNHVSNLECPTVRIPEGSVNTNVNIRDGVEGQFGCCKVDLLSLEFL